MSEAEVRPRWAWWAAAALIGVYAALALVSRLPGIGVGNDDAMYMFLAKSLLQGSYRDIFLPDAPWHLQYPPGWPLLIALPLAVVGDNPELLLFLPLLLSAAGLALLFDSARRILPPFPALAVLAVAAFNPLLITFGGRLKSEAAFFFFAMLALWALGAPEPSRRRLLLGSVAAIASAFMRSAGVAVIAAVFLHFALARRWRWAFGFGAAAALLFGPWLAWSFLGPRQTLGRSYAGDLDLPAVDGTRVREGLPGLRHPVVGAGFRLARYVAGHLHAMMGFKQAPGTLADNIGWVSLLATAGVAGLVVAWRRFRVLVLALGCLFAILSIWTWADRRFLHPVVPLVGLVLIAGAHTLGRRLGRGGSAAACLVVLILLTPGTWSRTSRLVSRGWSCTVTNENRDCYNPVEVSFLEAAAAGRALPDTAVVLTNREAAFAYHSGRRGVYSYDTGARKGDELIAFLRTKRITHILISRIGDTGAVQLAGQLVDLCRWLEPIGEFSEGATLFAVLDAPRPDPEGQAACRLTARIQDQAVAFQEERNRRFDFFRLGDSPED